MGIVTAVNIKGETVQLRPGYQFNNMEITATLDGRKVTAESLTHEQALRLLKEQPSFFRQNMTRGNYLLDDPYWQQNQRP